MSETKLPQALHDLKTCFNVETDQEVIYLLRTPDKLSESQSAIWKYSGGALRSGRPLDSTIIMMAGASGAGKSTTINALFNDPNLCKTNDNQSETSNIVLVQKHLEITKETPTLQTTLNFVDVSGIFDTNYENEHKNQEYIRRFKSSRIELQDRTELPWLFRKYYSIPKLVYHNIILFVVKADDNRMDGPNSGLRKTLQVFRSTGDLIDFKKVNLIVVLTHVMNLTRKHFVERFEKRKDIIKKAVKEILGIRDVDVIPIENQPDDYDLPKRGDYYQLPNGEHSHLNLFKAMQRCLSKNKDLLALLSISWYYKTDCPDRKKKAEIIETHIEISEDDLQRIRNLTLVNTQISLTEEDLPCQMYNMQCLGYGYCPVTEQVKAVYPLKEGDEPNQVEIGRSQFLIPSGMSVFYTSTTKCRSLSFLKKQEYEEHMKNSYGLDAGIPLVVSANSEGKWIEERKLAENHSWISHVQEIQVATLRLQDPNELPKSDSFLKALNNLPDEYTEDTESSFWSFFNRWGTHLIYEQALGGSIQLDCKLKEKSITRSYLNEVQASISGAFGSLFSVNPEYSFSQQIKKLRSVGVAEETLEITGGNPPPLPNLETVNTEVLQEWAKSVPSGPSELRQTMRLYPYYSLLDEGKKSESLRQATEEYLKNGAKEKMEVEYKQNEIADGALAEVVEIPPEKSNCFPKGAMISFVDGSFEAIENLGKVGNQERKLTAMKIAGFGQKLKICGPSKTKFCAYLDAKREEITEYFCFRFSNGKKLLVSLGHVIFQYLPEEKRVIGKQAKYFEIGEQMVYRDSGNTNAIVEFPVVVEISKEYRVGAFCPLTCSGTFFVEGFFVSSYSNTDFFALGQFALAPLKLYRMLTNVKTEKACERDACNKEGIHPYAKFLISSRKMLTFYKKREQTPLVSN